MSEIPDDVRRAAERAAVQWLAHVGKFGKEARPLSDAIADAITAERERCAKIAADFPPMIMEFYDRPGEFPGNYYRQCLPGEIASAIRSPSNTETPT